MTKDQPDPLGQAVHDFIDGLEGKAPIGEATIAGEAEFTNEQRSRIPYVMAMYHDCFLCGAPPPPVGMYTWKMDGQTIVTPVCADCAGQTWADELKDRIKLALRQRGRQ